MTKKILTNAEIQANYRKKKKSEGTEKRINTWINQTAFFSLERLTKHYGITQKELIENLLNAEEEKVIKATNFNPKKFDQYLGK